MLQNNIDSSKVFIPKKQSNDITTITYLHSIISLLQKNFDFKQKTCVLYVNGNTVAVQVIIFKQIVSTLQGFVIKFLSNSAGGKKNLI